METHKSKWRHNFFVMSVIMFILCQFVVMEKSLFSQSNDKNKKFFQQTQRSMNQFNKNLQNRINQWQQNTTKSINRQLNRAGQQYKKSGEQFRQNLNRHTNRFKKQYKRTVNQVNQSINRNRKYHHRNQIINRPNYSQPSSSYNSSNHWRINFERLSSTAQSQIQRLSAHSPSAVQNCVQAFSKWGDSAGTKMTRIYKKYNRSVGDRLYRELNRSSQQVRSKILDCYDRFGPAIGDTVRHIYSRHGTATGQKVHSVFVFYGESIGKQVCDVYNQVSPQVGIQISDNYLPGIVRSVSDKRNQELAIKTVSCVLDLYRNRKEIVYNGIKIIVNTPIATQNGEVTLSGTSRHFVRTYFPYLKGTDIEEDPAKVVTYCMVCPDKKAIFSDLRLIPNPDGKAQTLYEKLDEVGGKDIESTIEILDLMADIEAVGEGDIDPEIIVKNSRRVQKLVKHFDTKNQGNIEEVVK